jgi:malate dehydrogenase
MDRRISVIGAGNVGATVAHEIARQDLAKEVVMVDVREGIAEGKALDIWQSSSISKFNSRVVGVTADYASTHGSSIVVITAGMPRKPGMSRNDLIQTNALIVKEATEQAIRYSPEAIIIVVSNPVDVMTYTAYKASGKAPGHVFGMSGVLDTARYKAFVAEALNVSPIGIHALLMGTHGDNMVPLKRYTSVSGIPVQDLLSDEVLDKIYERTRQGGSELVNLMGMSAWYAPGAAVAAMVNAINRDERRVFPLSAYLHGEYGFKDIYMGVPVILGKNGVERILQLKLNEEEIRMLKESAESIYAGMDILNKMNLF